jgi:hypothetical protein
MKKINSLDEWDQRYEVAFTKKGIFEMLHNDRWDGLELHRTDGPATIRISVMGTLSKWYVDDKLHRIDGPAMELIKAKKIDRRYFLDDEEFLTKGDYNEALNQVRNMSEAERLTDPRWWVRGWK